MAGANHFADPEAGLLLGVLDKRQQDAVTGFAPDNSSMSTLSMFGQPVVIVSLQHLQQPSHLVPLYTAH